MLRHSLLALAFAGASTPQPQPVDYPLCVTVDPGPIQPQVDFHAKHRLNGAAPVSPLA